MTVEELFKCFSSYFDEINYYDRTNYIKDSYLFEDFKDKNSILGAQQITFNALEKMEKRFLKEYEDYEVTDWQCDVRNCSIYVEIKK